MSQQRTSRKPNDHPGPNGRPYGHGPAYAPASPAGGERGGVPAFRGQAASDDASGDPVAHATALPAVANLHAQASTVREACAEVAPPPPNETAQQLSAGNHARGDKDKQAKKDKPEKELPPGEYPLRDNPAEFVEEIHRGADLFIAWQELLNSKDEKVKQRAVEKLTEMRYKGAAALAEEPQRIVIDMPRPDRD